MGMERPVGTGSEDAIGRVLEATNRLVGADSVEEVAEAVVGTASGVFGLGPCGVYRYDPETDTLRSVATSEPGGPLAPAHARVEAVREAFLAGEPTVVEDVGQWSSEPPVECVMVVPLADHGVFVAGADRTQGFDGTDRRLARLLADAATTALDRLEAHEAAETRTERLLEFSRALCHDVRNPVAVGQGWVDLARTDDPETRTEALDNAATALDRIDDLVDSARSLTRTGTAPETTEELAFERVVRDAWTVVTTPDRAELTVLDPPETVRADESRLRHVLENLFANSVEHGSTDGEPTAVTVGGLPEGGFYVADDGPGIPPEDRETVFEQGYTTGDGSGFGLAIARVAAEAHGWSLSLTESGAGGARFEVRF